MTNASDLHLSVHADFVSYICDDNRFLLAPGATKEIYAGICDLKSVVVFDVNTRKQGRYDVQLRMNPQNGLTVYADKNGYPVITVNQ